ncbi:hypothetical protein LJPFL01_2417 [Lelliottia jeotgali]|nr:hypothetical protein LJPFL01_2417 [Lelliottia jeotgali]
MVFLLFIHLKTLDESDGFRVSDIPFCAKPDFLPARTWRDNKAFTQSIINQ